MLVMFEHELVILCFILALVCAYPGDAEIKLTTQKSPELQTRFFGLENILGQMFHGARYHNQHNPQAHFNNWQQMQTPDQAQSNLDQHLQSATVYPQGNFVQNNVRPGPDQNQTPIQFPNQQQINQQLNMDHQPPEMNPQGNFNAGNNFQQDHTFNTGTLDDIPFQNGISQNSRPGNMFQNQIGNQFQSHNGNQLGSQNQNQQGVDDYNPVAILGKPVTITSSVPDSIVFKDGCDTPSQRQCVQDCQSSTEYSPVCGSNNVTYYNPGRFICARNCGVNVFVQRDGRCNK